MTTRFHYNLPEEKIAIYPMNNRSDSKLLYYSGNIILETNFNAIDSHLPPNSLLVRNSSKVLKARLYGKRESGGTMEIFCLNFQQSAQGSAEAECLIKNVKKLHEGELLTLTREIGGTQHELRARFIGRMGENSRVCFMWNDTSKDFHSILDIFGNAPLPPYMKRKAEEHDSERYQTIYATENGSVAAPTAGLHFTPQVDEALKKKHIDTAQLILHVGLGTFQPMKTENYQEHTMHSESFSVSSQTLELILEKNQEKTICVGTTSLRTLESLYIAAHFINSDTHAHQMQVQQFDYQNIQTFMSREEAWKKLLDLMKRQNVDCISGNTSLMITPEYICRTSDMLVTNFHQPDSTLLLIVASFIGDKWREVYDYALSNDFRFLSYGDACLFENLRAT